MNFKKSKLKNYVVLFISLFITVQALSFVHFAAITADIDANADSNDLPSISSIDQIIINDTNPTGDWETAKSQYGDYITGFGTEASPYIIKDYVIDGSGGNLACIVINDSRAYFEIENVTCKNAGSSEFGLYMYNTTNGVVRDSFFLNNSYHSIRLENCNWTSFENNFINNSRHARLILDKISYYKWDNNYWDNWIGFGPKMILGYFESNFSFPWVNFDWHPAREPFDINIYNCK